MKMINRTVFLGAIPIIIILLVWQIISQEKIVSPVFLPPVSSILLKLYTSFTGGNKLYSLPQNSLLTLERMFLGYFLGAAIAIPLGLLIGSNKRIHRLLEPTLEILRPLPAVALIPVFILLIGINIQMFIVFIAYGCIWPILINTIDGVKSIEPLYFDVAKLFRVTAKKAFFKVTLPASSPFIASGMRISLLLALLLTIVIEMTSGFNGLGWSTIYAQQLSDITTLYAEIFLISIVGFCLNFVFIRGENRVMNWHKQFTKSAVETTV